VAGAGSTVSTSRAGLSSLRALNAACRSRPSAVKPSYSISATSSGCTQCTLPSFRGEVLPLKGHLAVSSACSFGRMRASFPGQTRSRSGRLRPTCRRGSRPRSASGRPRLWWCKPPITPSCPARHLDFVQVFHSTRLVRGVQPLGDDAFQVHPAGRQQHRVASGDEMVPSGTPKKEANETVKSVVPCGMMQ
jgi:hypothetical protein